ncbi:efflux RND transporter permease subunit [Flammeovirga yaeyamensis]|uniref:Efflux RND transporter permease subunit n=1 Tax=Flammeovirga yaeyamensis TaxID=367791 RepID=A0AAX1N748_9BACT|nr:efflux RND transporter permease subunit [Flammeovirga yaeyamensis]MBB3699720.1 multidrug efflux pump subunit AcrB [Flammeovirga yaeyamensis]NMF36710.1 efflux RND transporter permease subunit [Flammeovirga yaeyamensis]QWG02246.1 efflux RND transporter permease subunit [Flammeovirga yaeyamensis]
MKKLISYFIKFPVAVNLVMALTLVLGFMAARNMTSTFMPNAPMRFIYVDVVYPGSSAEEIEEGVILKIEEELKGLEGLDQITSYSQENVGKITLEMFKGTDMDEALTRVKNVVEGISSFPLDVESVVSSKHEDSNFSFMFGITGEGVSLKSLKETARKVEKDLLAMKGISKIEISGYPSEEIAILLQEDALESYNMTFEEVAMAVQGANLDMTGGSIKDGEEEFYIRANNKGYSSKELDHIIIRQTENGGVIRLKDVAKVVDQWEDAPARATLNGKRAVTVTINNTFSEDILQTADVLHDYIETFNEQNEVLHIDVIRDQSDLLGQRLDLLIDNGVMGIVLVLVVLSLFLNPRIAFWVALGIPFSIFGMFILISFTGVTINMISLFALIVVLGILVDDAIVVAENIYQHYEKGKPAIRAAIDGTMEVLPAVISAVLTTIVAFSTFLFLDGTMGDFFKDMSWIVGLILFVSLIECLIVLPAHLAFSKAFKKDGKTESNIIIKTVDKYLFLFRDKVYKPVLAFALKNKAITFSITIALFIFTVGMMAKKVVPATFFPNIEGDDVTITLVMPNGTQQEVTEKGVQQIEAAIDVVNDKMRPNQQGDKDIIKMVNMVYMGSGHQVQFNLTLLGAEVRQGSTADVSNMLSEEIGKIPGAESISFASFSPFGDPVVVSLRGDDLEELEVVKKELKLRMEKMPELRNVKDNNPTGNREIHISLKEKAYQLGLTEQQVISQIRQGFFGYEIQRIQRGQDEVKVWVRYDMDNRNSFGDLEKMKIRMGNGVAYPFSEVANFEIEDGYSSINHIDFNREMKLTAQLKNPDDALPDILNKIKTELLPDLLHDHQTVEADFDGQKREQEKVSNSAAKVIPIVFILMFTIVVFTLRSFSQAFTVFALVPLSFIWVVLAHYIHGFAISMMSFMGIIALLGVMVNDALVLINAFNLNLKAGMKFDEALIEACVSRFRPIFLTTVTTVAGMGPMVLEKSLQAQFLIPMVITISYGIAGATLITLIILPVCIKMFNQIKVKLKELNTGVKVEKESVESAIKELAYDYEEA